MSVVCRRLTQSPATNVPFCDRARSLPEWPRAVDRAVAHGMRKCVVQREVWGGICWVQWPWELPGCGNEPMADVAGWQRMLATAGPGRSRAMVVTRAPTVSSDSGHTQSLPRSGIQSCLHAVVVVPSCLCGTSAVGTRRDGDWWCERCPQA
ncbi:hypothetical protein XpiCFBP4643_06300 [Xanthomonas pisi]|uniref:Uncharacterized protein n=1 Tax=Xanthomonas pisi TaxID=56457 RepID=A0A2S7D5V3_9XANT|nr:hypothetical protein XpiCFBP4643_06300 [Xanthomonas pisi]